MIFELISEGQEECQMREREELAFKEKTGTLGRTGRPGSRRVKGGGTLVSHEGREESPS